MLGSTFPTSLHDDTHMCVLIASCLMGDEAAHAHLFQIASPHIYRLAYSILLNRQDAEDATQEAFVYAFRNLANFDPQRGTLRTWLYTIVVSRCRNARRRKWLPTVDLGNLLLMGREPSTSEEHSPAHQAAWASAREVLQQALTRLSPRLREAIALRYGHDLTYREMAEVLNCPQKTAESRVRLAHEALRAAMTAEDAALVQEMLSI